MPVMNQQKEIDGYVMHFSLWAQIKPISTLTIYYHLNLQLSSAPKGFH